MKKYQFDQGNETILSIISNMSNKELNSSSYVLRLIKHSLFDPGNQQNIVLAG